MRYLILLLLPLTANAEQCDIHAEIMGKIMLNHQEQRDMSWFADLLIENLDSPQRYLNYIQEVKLTPQYVNSDEIDIAVLTVENKYYEECINEIH